MLTLLTRSTTVLNHSTPGISMEIQSSCPPLSAGTPRTMYALVSATNSIRMLASATHIPIRYFSGSSASSRVQPGGQFFESSGPGGPPPGSEAPPSPGLIPISVVNVVGILDFGFWILDFWTADC